MSTPPMAEVLTKIYGKVNRAKVQLAFGDTKNVFDILQEISDYMASIDLTEQPEALRVARLLGGEYRKF